MWFDLILTPFFLVIKLIYGMILIILIERDENDKKKIRRRGKGKVDLAWVNESTDDL